jgi:hypothetical protein
LIRFQIHFIAEQIYTAWDADHALIKLGFSAVRAIPAMLMRVDARHNDLLCPRLFLDLLFGETPFPRHSHRAWGEWLASIAAL